MNPIEGQIIHLPNKRFGIVVSRFNSFITEKLLSGCIDSFKRHGYSEEQTTLVWVPGAWEIPVALKKLAETGKFSALIGLGAVIRGGTAHFEHVANECAKGMAQISLDYGLPVINAVLATESIEQAIERAGTKLGNKGWEAACTAIEMVDLIDHIQISA